MGDSVVLPRDLRQAISEIVADESYARQFRKIRDEELFNKNHSPESLFKSLLRTIDLIESRGFINPSFLFNSRTMVVALRICHHYGWINDWTSERPYKSLECIESRLRALDKDPFAVISKEMRELGLHDMASQYVEDRDAFIALMERERSIVLLTDAERIAERIKQCEQRADECVAADLYFYACVDLASACEALLSLRLLLNGTNPRRENFHGLIEKANELGLLQEINDGQGNKVSPYSLLHEIRNIWNKLHPLKDLRRVGYGSDCTDIKQAMELGRYARVRRGYVIVKWRLSNA